MGVFSFFFFLLLLYGIFYVQIQILGTILTVSADSGCFSRPVQRLSLMYRDALFYGIGYIQYKCTIDKKSCQYLLPRTIETYEDYSHYKPIQ